MACELGRAVIPWSPLSGGVLAGKYSQKDMVLDAKSDIDAARQDVVKGMGQLTEHGNKWNDTPEKGNIDDFYFGYINEINNKIQNETTKFSLIDSISHISVASDVTTHQ